MLNPKTNGALLSLYACFQDGHLKSYIVVDSLFNVPRNICGGLFYYASRYVISIFVSTMTRKRMIVALLYLSS